MCFISFLELIHKAGGDTRLRRQQFDHFCFSSCSMHLDPVNQIAWKIWILSQRQTYFIDDDRNEYSVICQKMYFGIRLRSEHRCHLSVLAPSTVCCVSQNRCYSFKPVCWLRYALLFHIKASTIMHDQRTA